MPHHPAMQLARSRGVPAAPSMTLGVPQPQHSPTVPPPGPGLGEAVVAKAAGPRPSSIRSTMCEARDWLQLYVTEEERQHQGLFFFPFILILLQSLSKNNPSCLPQECSASEPWLPRPLCISLEAAEQSHYRCHSVTLVKSTFGEGGQRLHCFGCRRAGTDGRTQVSSARHFPGCGVGWAEHPPPSPLLGTSGTLLASGNAAPAGVSRWRCSLAR